MSTADDGPNDRCTRTMPTSGPSSTTSTRRPTVSRCGSRRTHDSRSHASYRTGRSTASSSTAPSSPAGSSSRPRATSMTERRLPSRSHETATLAVLHRAVRDDDAVGRIDGRGDAPRRARAPVHGTPRARRRGAAPTPSGRLDRGDDDLVAVDRGRVGQHGTGAAPAPRRIAATCASRSAAMRGVARLRLGVHPGDRRAGDDVVELQREDLLPRRIEVDVRRRRSPTTARPRGAGARTAGCRASCAAGW